MMGDNCLHMAESFPILNGGQSCSSSHETDRKSVLWLQGITLTWMAVEAGISLYAAAAACSIALLAFGSDSLVELLSAGVVVWSVSKRGAISRDRAARWAGILLFALAGVVAIGALRALITGVTAEVSPAGIGITIAALIVMPVLASSFWMDLFSPWLISTNTSDDHSRRRNSSRVTISPGVS